MKDIQRKLATFRDVKQVGSSRRFRGIASTWEMDLGGDIVHRGAYARTLDHWRASKGRRIIPLVDQHQYSSINKVVGKLISAEETAAGLECEFEVVDSPTGDEALARIRDGYINKLSIGYEVVHADNEKTPDGTVRHLREIRLSEISLVIWPMNEGAIIPEQEELKQRISKLLERQRQMDSAKHRELSAKLQALLPRGKRPMPEDEARALRLKLLLIRARRPAPHTSTRRLR